MQRWAMWWPWCDAGEVDDEVVYREESEKKGGGVLLYCVNQTSWKIKGFAISFLSFFFIDSIPFPCNEPNAPLLRFSF